MSSIFAVNNRRFDPLGDRPVADGPDRPAYRHESRGVTYTLEPSASWKHPFMRIALPNYGKILDQVLRLQAPAAQGRLAQPPHLGVGVVQARQQPLVAHHVVGRPDGRPDLPGTAVDEQMKRARGFAHRTDIQTFFDFHWADEAED